MSYRKDRKRKINRNGDPVWLAKQLPLNLRSFDEWVYAPEGMPVGLRDYQAELREFLTDFLGERPGDWLVTAVMHQAAGEAGVWYRLAFAQQDRRRMWVVRG